MSLPSTTSPQAPFQGLWLPLVTPFLPGDEAAVDHGALRALVQHYNATGIAGYVACGSTAEAAALSEAERSTMPPCPPSSQRPRACPWSWEFPTATWGMRWPAFRH